VVVADQSVSYSHSGIESGSPSVFRILRELRDMVEALSALLGVAFSRLRKRY